MREVFVVSPLLRWQSVHYWSAQYQIWRRLSLLGVDNRELMCWRTYRLDQCGRIRLNQTKQSTSIYSGSVILYYVYSIHHSRYLIMHTSISCDVMFFLNAWHAHTQHDWNTTCEPFEILTICCDVFQAFARHDTTGLGELSPKLGIKGGLMSFRNHKVLPRDSYATFQTLEVYRVRFCRNVNEERSGLSVSNCWICIFFFNLTSLGRWVGYASGVDQFALFLQSLSVGLSFREADEAACAEKSTQNIIQFFKLLGNATCFMTSKKKGELCSKAWLLSCCWGWITKNHLYVD